VRGNANPQAGKVVAVKATCAAAVATVRRSAVARCAAQRWRGVVRRMKAPRDTMI